MNCNIAGWWSLARTEYILRQTAASSTGSRTEVYIAGAHGWLWLGILWPSLLQYVAAVNLTIVTRWMLNGWGILHICTQITILCQQSMTNQAEPHRPWSADPRHGRCKPMQSPECARLEFVTATGPLAPFIEFQQLASPLLWVAGHTHWEIMRPVVKPCAISHMLWALPLACIRCAQIIDYCQRQDAYVPKRWPWSSTPCLYSQAHPLYELWLDPWVNIKIIVWRSDVCMWWFGCMIISQSPNCGCIFLIDVVYCCVWCVQEWSLPIWFPPGVYAHTQTHKMIHGQPGGNAHGTEPGHQLKVQAYWSEEPNDPRLHRQRTLQARVWYHWLKHSTH